MQLETLKQIVEKSPHAQRSGREPLWGDAKTTLELQGLPKEEKMFISLCLRSAADEGADEGLDLTPPAVEIPEKERTERGERGWEWVSSDEAGTPIGSDGVDFFCLFAIAEDGDFVVSRSPVPWDFGGFNPSLAEMKSMLKFSFEPIEFFRQPNWRD